MPLLAHSVVHSDAPTRWALILHGILGSGRNWRSMARRITDAVPDVGAVLVDLRLHGDSQGLPSPHSVAAAAADLVDLEQQLRADGRDVTAVIGHSFGGKVGLAYGQARRDAGLAELSCSWIVDSSPSARPDVAAALTRGRSVTGVSAAIDAMDVLGSIGESFESRDAFVSAVRGRGIDAGVAQWLALGLRRSDSGFALGRDLGGLRELLADYYAVDLWSEVDRDDGPERHFAVAGRGSALSAEDIDHLEQLALRSRLTVHSFANAGHWIHTDAPAALADAIAGTL